MFNLSLLNEEGFYKFKYNGSMPTFPNGTDICCGECRFSQVHPPTLSAELMIACIMTGFWSGAVVAFFVQKVVMSFIPPEFWYRIRFFISSLIPCLAPTCMPGGTGSDGDKNSLNSRHRRDGIATAEIVSEQCDSDYYIFDDWRNRAMEFNECDGIDETCHGNVTVHAF